MADQETRTTRRSSMANLGILLIVVGIVILALQYVRIDLNWLPQRWAELSWPLHIIIPGLALFVVGLVLPDRAGEGLSGFGLVAAAVGTLLWYQAITGTWESWAYAWALVLPAAGGIASIIHGTLHANWRHVRDGVGGLAFGLVAFVVLGYMFEGWLGFEGFGLNRITAWVPGGILLGSCWQWASLSSSRALPVNAAQGAPSANSDISSANREGLNVVRHPRDGRALPSCLPRRRRWRPSRLPRWRSPRTSSLNRR